MKVDAQGMGVNYVFINCPFDDEYIPLLRPLLFTVLCLGYLPRMASERLDSGEQRLERICQLIQSSKFSIHDLSRMRSKKKDEIHRLNMPFELGIDFGCRVFGEQGTQRKIFLVLEKEKHTYDKAISDLSGMDIKSHNDDPEDLIRQVRNWFVENGLGTAESPARIWDNFNQFMADFYEKRENEGFSNRDLQMMPVPEYVTFVNKWLQDRKGRY